MDRIEALDLIEELEETRRRWKERYPKISDEALQFMKGQHVRWQDCPGILPFNRRQRKRFEKAENLVVHLFAGNKELSRRWEDLRAGTTEVISLDILSGQNLHNPKLWSYLWWLATTGRIRAVIGLVGRPRPLRGRDHNRFQLPRLSQEEQELVHGDAALIFKMLALYEIAEDCVLDGASNGCDGLYEGGRSRGGAINLELGRGQKLRGEVWIGESEV